MYYPFNRKLKKAVLKYELFLLQNRQKSLNAEGLPKPMDCYIFWPIPPSTTVLKRKLLLMLHYNNDYKRVRRLKFNNFSVWQFF